MESSHFEIQLEQLIEREKNLEPNPFQATRIIQRIEAELSIGKGAATPVWAKVFQPAAISLALVSGILIGTYFGRNGQKNSEPVMTKSDQIETLRTELYITDVTDEDNILNLNQ